jgi:OOP family OmpA-OmpF porin
MKSRIIYAAALLVAASVSGAAHAQGWMRSSQELGFYAGGTLGHARANDFCSDATALGFTSCDEKDRAWKLFGGYRFHPNIAVEGGYSDLGKYSASIGGATVTAKVKAFELHALGIFPVWRGLSLYGKAGLARWDIDAAATGGLTASDKGTDFTFGFGAQYDFTPNLGARVEWQRYTDIDINTIGVSLLWMFR